MSSVFEGKRIHPDEKWNMGPEQKQKQAKLFLFPQKHFGVTNTGF